MPYRAAPYDTARPAWNVSFFGRAAAERSNTMMIGLTGPSGAGKSTVAALFGAVGFRIIDCDGLVHELDRDALYLEKIRETFGEEYVLDGILNRKKLASLVFSDERELARLNRLIAPFIYRIVIKRIGAAKREGGDTVLDAPLLFEYGLESVCDATVGVVTDRKTALRRLSVRDGKSEEELLARLSAQHDESFFIARCDFIIRNGGSREALCLAFAEVLKSLEKRRNS